MKKYSFFQRFKYWLDNKMSKGLVGMISILGISLVVFVLVFGVLTDLVTNDDISLPQTIWDTFSNTVNAWIISFDDAGGNILHLLLMGCAGIVGILVTSILIGIFSNGIEEKVTNLKRGKSKVLEDNHVVILGFNRNTYKFVEELCNSQIPQCIVIAGDKEKEVMEEKIHNNISVSKNVKIVCRNIDVTDLREIACCSIENARAVVVVDPDDSIVIKTILTVTKYLRSFPDSKPALIATVNRERNLSIAQYAGDNRFFVFHTGAVVAKIMARACTQVGISEVFSELFSYRGSEIYFAPINDGEGANYKQYATRITDATPIGIVRNGTPFLNPKGSITLQNDDKIITLADHDVKLTLAQDPVTFKSHTNNKNTEMKETKVGIIGYTHYIDVIFSELEESNCKTTLTGILEDKLTEVEEIIKEGDYAVDVCDEEMFMKKLPEFDHIILLSDESYDIQEADNQSIYNLLKLRSISKKQNLKFNTVVELQRRKTKDLLEGYSDSEYIISADISSLIAAQLVFNPQLASVFKELISYEGNDICLENASDYVEIDREYSTKQLRAMAIDCNVVYLGYILKDFNKYVINPGYNDSIVLHEGDKLILLSDEE